MTSFGGGKKSHPHCGSRAPTQAAASQHFSAAFCRCAKRERACRGGYRSHGLQIREPRRSRVRAEVQGRRCLRTSTRTSCSPAGGRATPSHAPGAKGRACHGL